MWFAKLGYFLSAAVFSSLALALAAPSAIAQKTQVIPYYCDVTPGKCKKSQAHWNIPKGYAAKLQAHCGSPSNPYAPDNLICSTPNSAVKCPVSDLVFEPTYTQCTCNPGGHNYSYELKAQVWCDNPPKGRRR